MKIAIHNSPHEFHPRWVAYCHEQGIDFEIVNCYADDIIAKLEDCDALMWQFYQGFATDNLMAKQLMFSLQQSGKVVFPDFNSAWHFDDKLGQKYLLESITEYFAKSSVFYTKQEAILWAETAEFPKVFKLRGGAGSQNVLLVKNKKRAISLISKAFSRGFKNYDAWRSLKERWRKYRNGDSKIDDILKGLVRIIIPPQYSKAAGREVGYVYFQDFYPKNDSDTRVVVVGDKAFALKRMVRQNDFRASGSGKINYTKEEIDLRCVSSAFEITNRLEAQCLAFDYVFDLDNNPKVVEISYGIHADSYDDCEGYWDANLTWYPGKFNPYGWMVDQVIMTVKKNNSLNMLNG